MASLEELKRQRSILIAKEESKKDFRRMQREKVGLRREIKELRSPRRTAFGKAVKKGTILGISKSGKAIDKYFSQPVKKPIRKRKSIGFGF